VNNRYFHGLYCLVIFLLLSGCSAGRKIEQAVPSERTGMEGLVQSCNAGDSIQSILISKAEAVLTFEDERYEVVLTLYSKRDSIIFLSAVNSGFEILRASADHDTVKVIDRLNKIVYTSALNRRFGYSYPVNFNDLQNLVDHIYLCDDLDYARDDHRSNIIFEFDEDYIKKRIFLNRNGMKLNIFEFYHQKTNQYLMGERLDGAFKIYSNFMMSEFELTASGGERTFNRDIKIKMEVNPRKYTFTELR
jgi:hypothetical protein